MVSTRETEIDTLLLLDLNRLPSDSEIETGHWLVDASGEAEKSPTYKVENENCLLLGNLISISE